MKDTENLVEVLEGELKASKNKVNNSNKPNDYLLQEIENKEKELLAFKRKYR